MLKGLETTLGRRRGEEQGMLPLFETFILLNICILLLTQTSLEAGKKPYLHHYDEKIVSTTLWRL